MKIKINYHGMIVLKRFIFLAAFALLSFPMQAQSKYAVLVGINDYYEVKGVKSKESLNGSVNDANAMRKLLISRFGFKGANIDTIYNAEATRDHITDGLNRALKKCKAGDMMVFYYSGHGVWMKNTEETMDSVKRGMNQAMLTSDLYNYRDHFKCFLRDFTLKKYFNKFVDKKVVLTSIFDCCFSGNLAMNFPGQVVSEDRTKSVDFNELMSRLTDNSEELIDSITGVSITIPPGCLVDSLGAIKDTLDSDNDGVPDCKDKEKFTEMDCLPVTAEGVGKCPFDSLLHKTLNRYDDSVSAKENALVLSSPRTGERNFNATEVLTIAERDTIARPSETKNSRFLFISATTDSQKALEFKDQNNKIHGLFTASLLRVFDKYSTNISVETFFRKLEEDMKSYHKDQTPTLHSDPARKKNNLLGLKLSKH
ncbi:MAG: caspase family protein [Ferruginibacter sp.]|nr:caspase family protein [Ferruginibacter sp.]